MDFDFSQEQSMLRESVEKLIAQQYDFELRKKYVKAGGFNHEMWRRYAEMGLLGLPFPEAEGGFGGGPVETMIVMEAFGRGLILEPYLPTVVLGGALLRHGAKPEERRDLVARIATGDLKLAFAHSEAGARYDLAHVACRAEKNAGGWTLEGMKSLVFGGDAADALIVSARTGGEVAEPAGIGLFLVEAGAPGVSRRPYRLQDATGVAEIGFHDTPALPLGTPGEAFPAIERAVDEALTALVAEALGVMGAMQETTLEYIKTRQQFGRPIGQFQAIQHRAVDMLIAVEQARSMVYYATMMAAAEDRSERRRAVSAAKAEIGRLGRKVGQEAIQLHGGIGMTMEYKIGHYFKRMTMIELMFGDTDHHATLLADLGGLF